MKNLYKKLCDFCSKNKNLITIGMLGFVLGYGFYAITHTNYNNMHKNNKNMKPGYSNHNPQSGYLPGDNPNDGSVKTNTNSRIDPSKVPSATINLVNPVTFSGVLKEVNTGCFADGECYVVIDDKGVLKHVTLTLGWTQGVIGKIIGSESIGDLESSIGKNIKAFVNKLDTDNYTLYGDVNYYVDVAQK